MGYGSGGDIIGLHAAIDEACNETIPIVLSDKFSNLEVFRRIEEATNGRVGHIAGPADATQAPRNAGGLRTMFTAFHHLPPELAHKIIADAVNAETPILFAKFTERTYFN